MHLQNVSGGYFQECPIRVRGWIFPILGGVQRYERAWHKCEMHYGSGLKQRR